MLSRRNFIQKSTLAGMAVSLPGSLSFLSHKDKFFSYESRYLKLQLLKERPEFSFFSTDSLGGGQFSLNPLLENEKIPDEEYESQMTAKRIAYFKKGEMHQYPVWECSMQPKTIIFRTRSAKAESQPPFTIAFAQKKNHCTVLGEMTGDNRIKFPCVLHFPGMGTFRVYCSDAETTLFYDAELTAQPYIRIALPAADSNHPDITYRFESAAIFPAIDKLKNDSRFDGFRKNYINIIQLNPRRRILSNNSTSDACAFTVFLYAEMAMKMPSLVEGLTAMDLTRNTLDQYLGGMLGYGMVGKPNWQSDYDSSDTFPSLIMASCYYVLDTKDHEWAMKNFSGIREWGMKMIATDRNNDGIIEYGYSGNSGSWNSQPFKRPANWWDTIGFGHDDAYSNALAYRACALLAKVAETLNKSEDSRYFDAFAKKLKSNYFSRFYNPDTGVLGGWRSADGQLHDYYFTFVNSIAICYGLISQEEAKKIMRVMLDKMKEVGYTDFRLGLPGNLIPIEDGDYADHNPRWGYQKFQVYENGGATGCYAYYTIHALFKLGMHAEAKEILMPMLESYKEGGFQGSCPDSGRTRDWKTWKGECWGYEGFLVDNYLALLGVLDYLDAA